MNEWGGRCAGAGIGLDLALNVWIPFRASGFSYEDVSTLYGLVQFNHLNSSGDVLPKH